MSGQGSICRIDDLKTSFKSLFRTPDDWKGQPKELEGDGDETIQNGQ